MSDIPYAQKKVFLEIIWLLADLAQEQATREFSGEDWLKEFCKKLDKIQRNI